MLKYLKLIYWRITAQIYLIVLRIKFPVNHNPHLNSVHLPKYVTGNIEENHKAFNTVQIGTAYAIVGICFKNHSSLSDVLDSLYHEYRHIMQYSLVSNDYIRLWSELAKKRTYYYLASPIEVGRKTFRKNTRKTCGH